LNYEIISVGQFYVSNKCPFEHKFFRTNEIRTSDGQHFGIHNFGIRTWQLRTFSFSVARGATVPSSIFLFFRHFPDFIGQWKTDTRIINKVCWNSAQKQEISSWNQQSPFFSSSDNGEWDKSECETRTAFKV
jgi:hypothetical protein